MIAEQQYWYLRNQDLFNALTENELQSLCIVGNFKQGSKNDVILFSQTDKKRIYTIKEGIIKLCKQDNNGKEVITEILVAQDVFGYFYQEPIIENNSEEYAIVLSDKVSICSFELESFNLILSKNPNLSLKFTTIVNEKLRSFQQKYTDLIFKDVQTRVSDFYKRYAKHHATIVNNQYEMEMLLTHQEIADYIAASRQTVTSIINKMVEKGEIIYEGRKKVIIPINTQSNAV